MYFFFERKYREYQIRVYLLLLSFESNQFSV